MPDMPSLSILLAKKKPPMMDKSEDSPEMDDAKDEHSEEDAKHAVMSAFLKAVQSDDVEAALQAFKDLSDLVGGESEAD